MAGFQLVADAFAVFHQRGHAEVNVAAGAKARARDADLLHDLLRREIPGRRADAAGEQPRPDVAALAILRHPIIEQHRIGLRLWCDCPVQLGREVIEPAVGKPQFGIGVQLVVLAEAGDAGRAQRRLAQAKRADAKQHPAFFAVDAGVQRLDQLVDILTAPVRAAELAAGQQVALPRRLVGEVEFHPGGAVAAIAVERGRFAGAACRLDRVRIKIVVDVHAVDIVAFHHVQHDVQRLLRRRFLGRIHPQEFAVTFHHGWIGFGDVAGGQRRFGARVARPVGVEPGMQLQAARVRLGDPECQRIVHRLRRDALRARQIFAPRLEPGRVDRVGAGTHLQHHRVQVQAFGAFEDGDRFGALLRAIQVRFFRPVDVGHRRHPGGAKLARRRRRRAGDAVVSDCGHG